MWFLLLSHLCFVAEEMCPLLWLWEGFGVKAKYQCHEHFVTFHTREEVVAGSLQADTSDVAPGPLVPGYV